MLGTNVTPMFSLQCEIQTSKYKLCVLLPTTLPWFSGVTALTNATTRLLCESCVCIGLKKKQFSYRGNYITCYYNTIIGLHMFS